MSSFPTDLPSIEQRMHAVDPVAYATTRNYQDGAVTRLSPYLARGVLSTRQVFDHIQSLQLPWQACEKLIQELAWRDYWQQVWMVKGDEIKQDLKQPQAPILTKELSTAIVNATTGIEAVDRAIKELYSTGYMHNHMRMYVASICCNIAHTHWLQPAKWMYSQLLDGDVASNHLSWQWVAGAFSNKKYYANQANINTYFHSTQQHTFLDVAYEDFDKLQTPKKLLETLPFQVQTELPTIQNPLLQKDKPTLIYTYYNLDPYWHGSEDIQRVLLLEPSFFKENPVSQKCVDFVLGLAKNIPGIQVFVGAFSELHAQVSAPLIYKEHPTNLHFEGQEEPRAWMSNVEGYFPSFFAFWKKCKKEIGYQ